MKINPVAGLMNASLYNLGKGDEIIDVPGGPGNSFEYDGGADVHSIGGGSFTTMTNGTVVSTNASGNIVNIG